MGEMSRRVRSPGEGAGRRGVAGGEEAKKIRRSAYIADNKCPRKLLYHAVAPVPLSVK